MYSQYNWHGSDPNRNASSMLLPWNEPNIVVFQKTGLNSIYVFYYGYKDFSDFILQRNQTFFQKKSHAQLSCKVK